MAFPFSVIWPACDSVPVKGNPFVPPLTRLTVLVATSYRNTSDRAFASQEIRLVAGLSKAMNRPWLLRVVFEEPPLADPEIPRLPNSVVPNCPSRRTPTSRHSYR